MAQCISFPLPPARKRWAGTLQKFQLVYLTPCNLQRRQNARHIQQAFTVSDTSELLSLSNLDRSFSGKRFRQIC